MPLTNLEKTIHSKAEQQAKALEEKARRAAEARFEREAAHRREEHERRVEALKRALEGDFDRETGARHADDRRQVLKVKNEIIAEIFDRAVKGIVSLPNDGYAGWLGAQLKKLPEHGKGMSLRTNPRDKELVAKLAKTLGVEAPVSGEDGSIRGGFVALGKAHDFDLTTDSLMQSLRETLTEKVVSALFETDAEI